MATVLITGAAGFMGSHLVDTMLADGHTVIGLDNFDPDYGRQIKTRNLTRACDHDDFQFIEADICDRATINQILSDASPDWVLHWAARAGVRRSMRSPGQYVAVNVEGTVNLLEATRDHMPVRLIFASSSSVYGTRNRLPFSENADTSRPISPYAATKVAAEALCHTYHHLYGLPILCMRLFTVYGPRQRPDLAISKFARLMSHDRPIPLYGDGTATRDYTHVADVVAAVRAAMSAEFGFDVVNIGSGRAVSLAALVRILERQMGVHASLQTLPPQPGDMAHTLADINQARALLCWEPQISLEEGIRSFLDWFAQQPDDGDEEE